MRNPDAVVIIVELNNVRYVHASSSSNLDIATSEALAHYPGAIAVNNGTKRFM